MGAKQPTGWWGMNTSFHPPTVCYAFVTRLFLSRSRQPPRQPPRSDHVCFSSRVTTSSMYYVKFCPPRSSSVESGRTVAITDRRVSTKKRKTKRKGRGIKKMLRVLLEKRKRKETIPERFLDGGRKGKEIERKRNSKNPSGTIPGAHCRSRDKMVN